MTVPSDALLRWVATRSAVLGVVLVLGSLAFQDWHITVGVSIGAALALVNFWALRRLAARMLGGAGAGRSGAAALFGLKFLFLVGILYPIARYVPMNVIALLVGFSVVIMVILAGSIVGPPPEVESPPNG